MGGVSDIIYWVLALASGIAATAGYGVIALTPAEYKVSRRSFSAAAVFAGLAVILWGAGTEVNGFVRNAVVGVLGGAISCCVVEAVRWTNKREAMSLELSQVKPPLPTALSRVLNVRDFNLTFTTEDDTFFLTGWTGILINTGTEMVKAELRDYRLYVDGIEISKQRSDGAMPRFIGTNSQFNAFVKLSTKFPLSIGKHVALLDISTHYDTLPPSGERYSRVKINYELSIAKTGVTIDLQNIIEQIEN